jgi:hypothetical protein
MLINLWSMQYEKKRIYSNHLVDDITLTKFLDTNWESG